MKGYLRGQSLWQYIEEEKQPPQLGPYPTLNQIRIHEEETAKAPRALSHIHATVTDQVFTRIMACEIAKEAWDKLKEEFGGSSQTRNMQVLNLRREFETLKMQEAEVVKEYVDRLINVVNKIRLLREEIIDKKNCREGIAQEQRRKLRHEDSGEAALVVQQKSKPTQEGNKRFIGDKRGKETASNQWNKPAGFRSFAPCSHCKKKNHVESKCWFRPNVQCRACKQFSHIEKVCQNKPHQPAQQAQMAEDLQQTTES
ncbi:uncharacterized protein LOC116134751 [Pistacia vera]|uniref:uncharacterized protein LOC116134751 n=1 Tax=Pistacia vera TaxID=55513 RepID=UPI00126321C2|nr:uncharacterized protein LOC116134751 [Pistacia vera]